MRVLLARPDRIGDVVLTTPVIEALKSRYPEAEIGFLVRDYAAAAVKENPFLDQVIVYEPNGAHGGVSGWRRLVSEIKSGHWDQSILFVSDFFVASALSFSRIPVRVGLYTKLYAPLFFTNAIRQRRSLVEKHEADYNLDLLASLNLGSEENQAGFPFPSRVFSNKEALDRVLQYLKSEGLESFETLKRKTVLIHPGMGGSALNWPFQKYQVLVQKLLLDGIHVIVSAKGSVEAKNANRILSALSENFPGLSLFQDRTLEEMIALCELVGVVVAPSTGPLHLAVGVGTEVVGIYPPIRVQSVKRWGPYVDEKKREESSISPAVPCPEVFHCSGELCSYYNCMETVLVEEVASRVKLKLAKASRSGESSNE